MGYRIVIAPDKFKGSLTAFEVCDAIEKGLHDASSSFDIIKLPMADGGDGLSEVISYYINAQIKKSSVLDPLFRHIDASWLLSKNGGTAFIEMAKASGLSLLKDDERNPLKTSTFGTGELINVAIKSGVKQIIIGIGGSATNDGGIGMAAALGYKFLDKNAKELKPVGENLIHIHHIDFPRQIDHTNIEFQVACDVKNILYGNEGAAKVYAPQKGATAEIVNELEEGILNYTAVIKKDLGIDVSKIEGGGAAGGLGAGCVAFLQATLLCGIDLVMQFSNAEEHIKNAETVITGEGKVDEQTLQGKVVAGITSIAKKYNKPVIVFCGRNELSSKALKAFGITSVHTISDKTKTTEEAMKNAYSLLYNGSLKIGKYFKMKQ